MTKVGEIERATQNRVIRRFNGKDADSLGYEYLGNRIDCENNSNIEEEYLRPWLEKCGYSAALITRAMHSLGRAAALGEGKSLYDANRAVYEALRYGVKVAEGAGEQKQTVWLIDWKNPEKNHFAVAEEVTVKGAHDKRPDLVLYVNGIALGVIELKRSTVSVAEGIRQNLDNQKSQFIRPFFTTIQLVMAGNDSEGLRYGVIDTPERYFMSWKEGDNDPPLKGETILDRDLRRVCDKERFLEIIHDFMAFDAGVKKTCRHNQYFGVRAAQERVRSREGGIVWHTQGSGKSLIMVWLAKWIRENVTDARVLVITDRTELDEQIEGVFTGVSEEIYRTTSGADLIHTLNATAPWLICSLIHKFGGDEETSLDAYLEELEKTLPQDFQAQGDFYIFVDECHRTQSGKMHKAMKKLLPGAMFIGFTGTPLLKKDKQKSIEVFGSYIHRYRFDEAVRDRVVLNLRYEARDIEQELTSPERVDEWFALKTRGLSDLARAQLKKKWGTMQKVTSSRDRLNKIASDILLDMERNDRLLSSRGNAMLVSGSIYQACRLYEIFAANGLGGKCAIVTSYRPNIADIKGEESGEGETEQLLKYDIYRKMIAEYFAISEDNAEKKAEEFETEVKQKFVKEPGQMKLLIVVDKLLTGFDAPPATYLYIDKHMQDHGLFQAICRVNRLDGNDKEYGYIIDYRDLFKSLEGAIKDYTAGAFEAFEKEDIQGLLKNRLEQAREDLEGAREAVKALCEPVPAPRESEDFRHYFCVNDTMDDEALLANEKKRVALYQHVARLVRTYANLANEMQEAGYSGKESLEVKDEVSFYEKVREEVKLASGDYLDMKMFEPAMRHLLDTYIRAEDSAKISAFDDLGLIDMIVEKGIGETTKKLPEGIRNKEDAVAETIENNMRRVIIKEQLINPEYYKKMSLLLDALIQERRKQAIQYKEYLQKIADLARQVKKPETCGAYPRLIDSSALRALYDNMDKNEELALNMDKMIRETKKSDWRGNRFKEREVMNVVRHFMDGDEERIETIFEIVKNQSEY